MIHLKKQITGLMQTTVVVCVILSLCANKLFAQGMGIGTSTPASKLDVEGSVAIGATYSGTTAAPTNGLIVQGNVGIGTSAPTAALNVQSTIGAGAYGGILVQASFTNNSSKGAVAIVGARYANANVPFSGFASWDDNVERQIDINARLAVKDGHLQVQQTTAPTIATGAASTAASLSNATDIAGKISITTNTTAGVGATITFNKTFTVAPIVVITPTNGNAAAQMVSAQVNVTTTTSTFVINFSAAPTATAKTFSYVVIETQ